MKKIRINELARELEVKAHEILDRLPELGVTEKKTHSSSIDEDVAIRLRRLYGFESPESTEADREAAGEEAHDLAAAGSRRRPAVETDGAEPRRGRTVPGCGGARAGRRGSARAREAAG